VNKKALITLITGQDEVIGIFQGRTTIMHKEWVIDE